VEMLWPYSTLSWPDRTLFFSLKTIWVLSFLVEISVSFVVLSTLLLFVMFGVIFWVILIRLSKLGVLVSAVPRGDSVGYVGRSAVSNFVISGELVWAFRAFLSSFSVD
jgi:hypothetical protein